MRLGLFTIGIMGLIACNPPNPENEAPNIQLLDPEGDYDRETTLTTYAVGADTPFDMSFRLRDRDGDSPLSITLFFDPTPDNADNDDLVEIGSAVDLVPVLTTIPVDLDDPEGEMFDDLVADIVINVPDGLPEGEQALVARAVDNTGIGEPREARYDFVVNASITAPVLTINPAAPTAQDPVSGELTTPSTDPEGGTPFHEWRWTRTDPADPLVELPPNNPGVDFPATLPAVNTTRGETWEFCVTAFESPDGSPPGDPDRVQSRTECASVVIGNSPPGAPGGVDVLPQRPTAADPLFCDVVVDATDPDGDAVTYVYDWSLAGTPVVTGATSPWLDPAETAGGDAWTCTAIAVDESDATPLQGGSLESGTRNIADALLGAASRASRTIDGTAGSQLGTHAAVAPVETFNATTMFPQECLVIGLPTGQAGQGEIRSYRGSAIQVSSPDTSATGDAGDGFGGPLAVGDVEADGNNELVAGAFGEVWVVYSDALAPTVTPHVLSTGTLDVLSISSAANGFGSAIAVGDLFPLSPNHEVAISTVGGGAFNTVEILDGDLLDRADPDIDLGTSAPASTLTGDATDDSFGSALHAGADLDGDTIPDLVVSDEGSAVHVFSGGNGLVGSITTADASFTVTGTGGIGASVTTGDVNGDGAADLVIGAPASGAGGEVAVFLASTVAGGGTVAFSSADFIVRGNANTSFGNDVVTIPDPSGLFGDAIAVGAPLEDDGSLTQVGFVYVFTPDDIVGAATPQAIPATDASVSYFGAGDSGRMTVRSNASDLDNDGFPDLVLSAPNHSPTPGDLSGRVYVSLSSTL